MNLKKPVVAVLGGTGNEGPGLALRWADAGYLIIIGSRLTEKAEKTAARLNEILGINTIRGMKNDAAARAADISVLTVVQSAHQAALTARIDFRNPQPPAPPAAAEIAQEILGNGVRVVAAFQNVPAHALKKLDEPIDSDVLVCSSDVEAAEQVITLATNGGMKAFFAGSLENAITVEGLTAILISLNKYHKVKTASIGITGVGKRE